GEHDPGVGAHRRDRLEGKEAEGQAEPEAAPGRGGSWPTQAATGTQVRGAVRAQYEARDADGRQPPPADRRERGDEEEPEADRGQLRQPVHTRTWAAKTRPAQGPLCGTIPPSSETTADQSVPAAR